MVECFLAKEDVAGSTPVSRSKRYPSAVHFTQPEWLRKPKSLERMVLLWMDLILMDCLYAEQMQG